MDTKIYVSKLNSSYVQVDADEDIILDLNNYFAVYAEGYKFSPKYKNRIWDGKIRFFSAATHILPLGLLDILQRFADDNKYTLVKDAQLSNEESEFDEAKFKVNIDNALKASDGLKMRDYQEAACKLALQKKMGILQCCTSSGKSMIIYNMIRNLLTYKKIKKILLIVPNVSLVEQMYSDFEDYGWVDIEDSVEMLYSAKKPTFKLPVLISTWQSLQKVTDPDYYESIDAVIVDECHRK